MTGDHPYQGLSDVLDEATIAFEDADFETALTLCNELLASHPEYVDALLLRCEVYLGMEDTGKMLRDAEAVIELIPCNAEAWRWRGHACADLGHLEEAIEYYNEAIRLEPTQADFIYDRGVVYHDLGCSRSLAALFQPRDFRSFNKAIADFTTAIDLAPACADAYIMRALSFEETSQFDRAIEDLNQAIKLDPSEPGAFLNRGRCFSLQKRYDLACADFTRALELNPDYVSALHHRAQLHVVAETIVTPAMAMDDYTRLLELEPDDAEALSGRAVLYRESGDYEEALADIENAIRVEPERGLHRLVKETILKLLGRIDEAERCRQERIAIWERRQKERE